MSINVPDYPTSVWDGLSPRRVSRDDDASPEYEDWDQVTAEIIACQTETDANEVLRAAQIVTDSNLLLHNAVADNGGAVIAGAPISMKVAGTLIYADADGGGARRIAIGLLTTGGADSLAYDIALPGSKLTLTTGEWDAVAGTTGGLTAGFKYYLSDTLGRLIETTTPPTAGDTLLVAGIALSATVMLVQMDHEGLKV